MTEFTFVHAADLHLDAPFRGVSSLLDQSFCNAPGSGAAPRLAGRVPGSPAGRKLAHLFQNATFLALERLTALCLKVRADFLILAGDVYNSAESSLRARLALRDAFLRLESAGVGVFLVHGNHDPFNGEESGISWPANVTVFGSKVDTHLALRGDVPLAVVHGISHASAKEGRNLARLFKRKPPTLLEPDVFQIGILHCALAGQSGSHVGYAPCTLGDLADAGLDYWALGHVHSCRVMSQHGAQPAAPSPPTSGLHFGQHPFAAYSGSLQGLHVNEAGPHGCLVVRVDSSGRALPESVPLAPLQWENLAVSLDLPENGSNAENTQEQAQTELSDIPALESFLLERLESVSAAQTHAELAESAISGLDLHDYTPEAFMVRLTLTGRTALDHELRRPDTLTALQEHLTQELEGTGVCIRDMHLETRPLVDLEASLLRADLVGETLRTAAHLQEDSKALALVAEKALHPLFQRPRIRKVLHAPTEEELTALAEEAKFLCLDLLEGE